ncbi:TPA: hypothetical protein UMF63_000952 [Stenotrophomonas maltophilia]|nr:hypothetical protein [Stenotrophomonas maltophilia]
MSAKQLLHSFKKDVFLHWRKACISQYGKYIWPQIVYTGRIEDSNVDVIGVVFEINLLNQDVIYWVECQEYLQIIGVPVFYIDSRSMPPRIFQSSNEIASVNGLSPRDWPSLFNKSFKRNDIYDSFDEASIGSYEEFRRATNPRGTRACDVDAIEVFGGSVVGVEATEIWKVAPWSYFYKQFENVLIKRQGSYNLDAMMAQWIFINKKINGSESRLLFVLHKLLWLDFEFDGRRALQPRAKNGSYLSGYFRDANGSAVIDDEAVCVYFELNEESIGELHLIQNSKMRAYDALSGKALRKSIYDIYGGMIFTKE